MNVSLDTTTGISKKITAALQKWPFYVLLLPLFFVLHGLRENFGFIMPRDAASLWLFYTGAIGILYLLLLFFYRKHQKTGLLTLLLSAFFFFFGAIQDFLKWTIPQLNRYVILFPLFFTVVIITIVMLKRTAKDFRKLSLYLNLLLLLLSAYDFFVIAYYTMFPEKDKISIYPFAENKDYTICRDCDRPDIYFLLFDEYTSSESLKNSLGFDNSGLDSFLTNRNFRILKNSSGNYHHTPFSMASILNMSYINGLDSKQIDLNDFARCIKLVRENKVIKFLSSNGYDVVNYSIFDLAGNPSPLNQDLLPLKTKLITDRTLWGRMRSQILWNLFTGRFEVELLTKNLIYIHLTNNNQLFDLVKQECLKKNDKPRFIYVHFNMPHRPYYFDRNGKLKDREKIKNDYTNEGYLDNVVYTNKKLEELVTHIQDNSHGNAAIIIMGDHGYRLDTTLPQKVFFENQNAVYLPKKNYQLFYDSMSGVNQFRVIFNSLFKQNFPLLKDSTTFLKQVNKEP